MDWAIGHQLEALWMLMGLPEAGASALNLPHPFLNSHLQGTSWDHDGDHRVKTLTWRQNVGQAG